MATLVLVPLALGFYVLADHHFDQTITNQRKAADLQSRILETALLHQMMEQDTTLMTDILAGIRDQPSVRGAMILNHEGEVRIASDPSRVGEVVSRESPACFVCHATEAPEREHWAVFMGEEEEEILRTVRPIENRPQCFECHDPDTPFNGILILDTSLAEVRAGLREDATLFMAGASGLGLLLVGGIGLFVRRLVLVRLTRLGQTARRIAAGDLDERASEHGGDVITRLAADFNHMAGTVSALVTEVREQEAQLVSILNSLDDGLVVFDADGAVVAANRAFCRRVGMDLEEMRGHTCHDHIGPKLPCCESAGDCPASRCRATRSVRREVYASPGSENGRSLTEEVHASPVFDAQGRVVQVVEVWRDISQRVDEQSRLAEIEHLVALGTLASGFSHEVSTPLASILTCAESSIARIDEQGASGPPDEELLASLRERARIVRDQVLRCRRITEQFLRFSRGIPPSVEPVDLRQVVGTVVALVQATASEEHVTVEVHGDEPLPAVKANTEVVQHALLNLLVNAIQSCDGQGGEVDVDFAVDEAAVTIRVRDSGCGIPAEGQRSLFQPFRSAKPTGTGLGLFLSRSFVRRFGGDVQLARSAPGRGSTFEISLARAEGVAA